MKQLALDANAGTAHMSRTLKTLEQQYENGCLSSLQQGTMDPFTLFLGTYGGEMSLASANINKYIKIHISAVRIYEVFFYYANELLRCWV